MTTSNRYWAVHSLLSLALMVSFQGGACGPQMTPNGSSDTGSPVRKLIGIDGGTIEVTNARGDVIRLEVPSGALSQAVDIAIDPLDEPPASPVSGNVFPGIELQPNGLKLLKAATLKLTLAQGAPDARTLLLHLRQADFVMPLSDQAIAGNVISGRIRHFSTYLAGSPSDSEASQQADKAAGQSSDSSDWQATLDDIGGMMEWGEWFVSHGMGDQGQASFNQAEQALRTAIECFLDPNCHPVPIDICNEDYIREALAYYAQAQLLGFDDQSELMRNLNATVTHLLNQCTNQFAIDYDYLQAVNQYAFSQDIHVTGQVLFSLPVYVVSDIEPLRATGQGTVSGTITGVAGDCTITGSFTIDVVVEGQLESDEMGQPWLNLQLTENWYASGQQTFVCPEDNNVSVPLPPTQSIQNIRLLMQDGYVLQQPHLQTQGYYRWTLRVLHVW
ncbi:MAG: hypothetical protein KA354_08030 [Phycisphaerae bacterium]|nr:hypothetical protein [Phycisphaerae bacterium]